MRCVGSDETISHLAELLSRVGRVVFSRLCGTERGKRNDSMFIASLR